MDAPPAAPGRGGAEAHRVLVGVEARVGSGEDKEGDLGRGPVQSAASLMLFPPLNFGVIEEVRALNISPNSILRSIRSYDMHLLAFIFSCRDSFYTLSMTNYLETETGL